MMRPTSATLAALAICAAIGATADAQSPEGGRQTYGNLTSFLAAPASDVEQRFGLAETSADASLDSLVNEQVRVLQIAFGGPPARVRWVTRGRGTHFHPATGIGIDLAQIQDVRSRVSGADFDGILRFVIAHEWTHQVQDSAFRKFPLDSTHRRWLECHADFVAGTTLANYHGDVGVPGQQLLRSLKRYASVAFTLGTPEFEAPWMHPTSYQRLRCMQTGYMTGWNMRLLTAAERGTTAAAAWVDSLSMGDKRWFRSTAPDTLVRFSEKVVADIIANRRAPAVGGGSFLDPIEYIGRLAYAASIGPDTLRARAKRLDLPQSSGCDHYDDVRRVMVVCEFESSDFPPIAQMLYAQANSVAAFWSDPLKWVDLPERLTSTTRERWYGAPGSRPQMGIIVGQEKPLVTLAFIAFR